MTKRKSMDKTAHYTSYYNKENTAKSKLKTSTRVGPKQVTTSGISDRIYSAKYGTNAQRVRKKSSFSYNQVTKPKHVSKYSLSGKLRSKIATGYPKISTSSAHRI